MTALGLVVIVAGSALLWSGITGKNAWTEIRTAIQGGKPLPKSTTAPPKVAG